MLIPMQDVFFSFYMGSIQTPIEAGCVFFLSLFFLLLILGTKMILEKYTKTVNLEELINIYPDILNGKIAGRILVDLSK